MIILILGLVVFLGMHSIRIFADNTRTQLIEKYSDGMWKGAYSLISLLGLVLIIYGYGQTRIDPLYLWHPPLFTRHIATLLMLFSFVLLAAVYVPANAIKARVGHPMLLGIVVWALAHILANGRLGDVVLFASFLIWAKVDFIVCVRRDKQSRLREADNPTVVNTSVLATVATVVIGLLAFSIFALWLHLKLIGVSPFG